MSQIQIIAVIKNKNGQEVRAVALVDAPLVWNVFESNDGEVEKDHHPLSIEEWLIHTPDGRMLRWHPLPVQGEDED